MARGRKKKTAESQGAAQDIKEVSELDSEFGAPDIDPEKKVLNARDFELDLNSATLAELAEIAQHYSDRSYETLRRLTRAELLAIIKNESDTRDRAYQGLDRDADNLLKMTVELLDEVKRAREGKPLNPTLKRLFIAQNNKLTEVLVNANVKSGVISIIILLSLAFALFIDSFWGFSAIVEKLKKRANAKQTANQANQDSNQGANPRGF